MDQNVKNIYDVKQFVHNFNCKIQWSKPYKQYVVDNACMLIDDPKHKLVTGSSIQDLDVSTSNTISRQLQVVYDRFHSGILHWLRRRHLSYQHNHTPR